MALEHLEDINLVLSLLLPAKLGASSSDVTAHCRVENGVNVSAACQRHLHHLVQVVQMEPVRHLQQHYLPTLRVRCHCQFRSSSGCF